jgi:hypothetical protein
MEDIFDEDGSMSRHRRSVRDMSHELNSNYFADRAAKAASR